MNASFAEPGPAGPEAAPVVRPYRVDDAAACCRVINAAIAGMDGLNDAARAHIVGRNTPEQLGGDLATWTSFVAETATRGLVGVGALDGSEIRRIYVEPRAQARGIGQALLAALEHEAARSGVGAVSLDASPASVAFYASRGYAVCADGGFSIGAAEFSYVTMAKRLGAGARPPADRARPPARLSPDPNSREVGAGWERDRDRTEG